MDGSTSRITFGWNGQKDAANVWENADSIRLIQALGDARNDTERMHSTLKGRWY